MTQLIASGLTYEEAVPALINSQAVKNMGIGGNAMKSMYETLKLNTNPVYKLTSTLTDQQLTEMFPDQTPSKTRSMIAKLSMFGAMTLNPDGTFGWDMDLLNEMGMGMPKTGDVTTISVTAAGGTATGTGGTATGTGGTGVGGTATTTSFEDATGTTDQGGTGTGYTQGDPSDPNTVFEPGTTTTQTTVHGDPQFEPFTVVTDQPGQYQIPSIPGTSKVVDDGINYMVHYLNQGKSWEEIEAGLFNDYRYED